MENDYDYVKYNEAQYKEGWDRDEYDAGPSSTQIGGDHYKKYAIQPIDFILANDIPFCEANAIKYLVRWRDKGGVQDLEKAKHYIEMLIERYNGVQGE